MEKKLSELLADIYRGHFGKMTGALMYYAGIRNMAVAEDIIQEAFTIAAGKWQDKLPGQPVSWLYGTIRKLAYYQIRKENKINQVHAIPGNIEEPPPGGDRELLNVLLTCIQPAFSPKVQLVIALRYVNGLQVKRIAALLATNEDSISKIVYRWRLQSREITWHWVDDTMVIEEQKIRMTLKIIYVMFTEGFQPAADGKLMDERLCEDALSLLQTMININITAEGSVKALYALLLYHLARTSSRLNAFAELTALAEQDRSGWNKEMIAVANRYLLQSRDESAFPNTYQVEASIAYLHVTAESFEQTPWHQITGLYQRLELLNPSPFTTLNYAVALYFNKEEDRAICLLEALSANRFFQQYHLVYCFWAKIWFDRKSYQKALLYYEKAQNCPTTVLESKFIANKVAEIKSLIGELPC